MTEIIAIHEVRPKSFRAKRWIPQGKFHDWVKGSDVVLEIAFRQFGYSQGDSLRNAEVWYPKSDNASADEMLFLVRNKNISALLVRVRDINDASTTFLDAFRRTGVEKNLVLARELGVEFEDGINMYSVAISGQSLILDTVKAQNGWLVMEDSTKDVVALRSERLMLALSVATERALLNQATIWLSKSLQVTTAGLRLLKELRRWPTMPPIDNSDLADRYKSLRDSLNLDLRRTDVTKALELKERNLARRWAIFGALVAAAGLCMDNIVRF